MIDTKPLQRALGQLVNEGGATVWAPQVTTGQAARLEGLQQAAARAIGGEGRMFVESDWITYRASSGALPDAGTWTETVSGDATATVSGGALTITA